MKFNNKGFWHCCIIIPKVVVAIVKPAVATTNSVSFLWIIPLVLIIPLVWHMPAWAAAKHNHTEAKYQNTKMWPLK